MNEINDFRTGRFVLASVLLLAACSGGGSTDNSTPVNSLLPVSNGVPPPHRLFLQQVSSRSALLKWRGAADEACIARTNRILITCQPAEESEGDHQQVLFSDLEPATEYAYSVGQYADRGNTFLTAPQTGNLPPNGIIQLLVVGDSGSASLQDAQGNFTHAGRAESVLNGYMEYASASTGRERPDLFLMLGDSAYPDGTDEQYQLAVFDLYQELLPNLAVWPTIGNHEMGLASSSSDPNEYLSAEDSTRRRMPYLDIFTLPASGEMGGVSSNTEQYYSFDYGNLHVVSLDSQLSMRDAEQRAAMRDWLISDLSMNTQDWTIVFFHHPVYSKGSHDTDSEAVSENRVDAPVLNIRGELTPIFERHGVDLVLSGHSHSYERSYYLNGHRGDSGSFDATIHAELNNMMQPSSGGRDQAYEQISRGSQADDKLVYVVVGSSGRLAATADMLGHPANVEQPLDPLNRRGLAEMGSMVIEVTQQELVARFINQQGQVRDSFVIRK